MLRTGPSALETDDDLSAGPGPGHFEFAQHCVRRTRTRGGAGAAGTAADLSAARLGRARPDADLARPAGNRATGDCQGGVEGLGYPGAGHHQPAGNHGRLEPQDGPADPPCHRVAGPAWRAALRGAARKRPCALDPVAHRPVDRFVFFGDQDQVAAGSRPRGTRAGATRRAGLRHRGQLVAVAAHRRQGARERCQQCLAHHAVRHPQEPMGCRAARAAGRARVDAAGGAAFERAVWFDRTGPVRRTHHDRRRRRRPAKRLVRPGLLRGRHGQEHLRHRMLHADAYRRPVPELGQRLADHQRRADRQSGGVCDRRQRVRWWRGRAVAAGRAPCHQKQRRSAGPGRERPGFRRCHGGPGVHRVGRALLETRCPRHHHGADARHDRGAHRPGRA